MLILDEPTNDLDYETLELLEQLLMDFGGTLLLVSHDRTFLNNVVSSTIAFEGDGQVKEYIGGYDDWLRQRATIEKKQERSSKENDNSQSTPEVKSTNKPKKLSYKLQRELELLPQHIADLENKIEKIQQQMAQTDFYQQAQDLVAKTGSELNTLQEELDQAFMRWEELESSV